MQTARRWTNKQTGIVLLTLIVGGTLAATWPVWFAPPYTSHTFWLYSCLALLWFPVLIVLVIGHHRKAFAPFLLLLIVAAVGAIIVLSFAGPNFSVWAVQSKDCTAREVSPGETQYICTIASFSTQQKFTLEGPTGFPFARLVSSRYAFFD